MNENLQNIMEAVCGFLMETREKATFSKQTDKEKKKMLFQAQELKTENQ